MDAFYEEKDFDGELYFRTSPGAAFRKKAAHPVDTLLNLAQVTLQLKTRCATLDRLQTNASTVSRIRNGKEKISSEFVLRFHDATGLSIAEIRKVGNIPKLINAKPSGA